MIKWNPFREDKEKKDDEKKSRKMETRRYPFWELYDDDFWDWDPWEDFHRRSSITPFDSIFSNFAQRMEREFRRIEQHMSRMMRDAKIGNIEPPEKGGPIVYGFSMRVGPDGVPNIEEFGNVRDPKLLRKLRSEIGAPSLKGYTRDFSKFIEPLTDVMEDEKNITITIELPGVEKNDITLEAEEDNLTLKCSRGDRKYFKEIELPEKVDPNTIEAKYNNGVLDIRLKKKEIKKKGRRIPIK